MLWTARWDHMAFLAEGHLFSVPALLLVLDTQHSKGISTEDNLAQELCITEDTPRMTLNS